MAQRGERSDTHSCGVGVHPKRNDWCSYGCRGALHRQSSWLRTLTRCVRSACDTGGMLSTPRVGGWAGDVRVLVNEAELKPASGPGLRASHPRAGRVSHGGGQRAGHRRGRRPPAPARPAGLAALDSGVAVPRAAALCGRRPPVARVVAGSAADNRVIDWLPFFTYAVARVPRGYWVHVVADNAVTHQHPAVPAWLARHPQVVVHLVSRDRPLPRWFLPALQQWVRAHLPLPPRPPNPPEVAGAPPPRTGNPPTAPEPPGGHHLAPGGRGRPPAPLGPPAESVLLDGQQTPRALLLWESPLGSATGRLGPAPPSTAVAGAGTVRRPRARGVSFLASAMPHG